ncbi:MAG: response regulator transcription factor [Nannocystaceae bacterium]
MSTAPSRPQPHGPPRVLLVDDDVRLAAEVAAFLERHGLSVRTLHRGEPALVAATEADVVVLDWMLPGVDGLSVCQALRVKTSVPVLMLTARVGDESEILALQQGADDYLAKPVRPKVLLARLRVLLRRRGRPEVARAKVLNVGALRLDEGRWEATQDGVRLSLTDAEFLLLKEFMVHAGTMLSRDALSLVLTGRPFDGVDRTIDQYVSRLRRKIGDSARSPSLLKTVRGVGYQLVRAEPS